MRSSSPDDATARAPRGHLRRTRKPLGCVSIVYAVLHLGKSFSIMPQARRLVIGGPYRFVRHPLYFAEELAVIGVLIQCDRTMALLFRRTAPNADQTYPTDLWEWTGTAWSVVAGAGPTFSPIQPMVGLSSGGGLLLFDGGALQGTASTWIWQNVQWSRVSTGGPPLRNGHALAYDAARNRVVLFGGFRPGQDFSDTWEWNGTAWSQITPR